MLAANASRFSRQRRSATSSDWVRKLHKAGSTPCEANCAFASDLRLTVVKGVDHRFSGPAELDLIWSTVETVVASAKERV